MSIKINICIKYKIILIFYIIKNIHFIAPNIVSSSTFVSVKIKSTLPPI